MGSPVQPFWGGGGEVVIQEHVYFDVTVSRFDKTGQRAFINQGQVFQLGIPLTATLTPVEVSGGYRFRLSPTVVAYLGGGAGHYSYSESSSFADSSENVNVSHAGVLVHGGVELRVHRWIAISGDAQYTHVPGILGSGGISQQAGEHDLGGFAVRGRVLVGL